MFRVFDNIEDYRQHFDELQEIFQKVIMAIRRYVGY